MNRHRTPHVAPPPALYRMGTDRDGERMVVWPLYSAQVMAHDGRPDASVYVRRDVVRRLLVSEAVPPPPKPWPDRVRAWVGRLLSW